MKQRRFEAARHDLQPLVSADSVASPVVQAFAHLFLGEIESHQSRPDNAIEEYRAALAAEPRLQTASLALAHALPIDPQPKARHRRAGPGLSCALWPRRREAVCGLAPALPLKSNSAEWSLKVKSRYVLAFDAGDRNPGWHKLEVRLKNHPGEVPTRRGYFVAPC